MRLLIMTAILSTTLTHSAEARPRPLVGAIRWDAWTGGPVTAEVERTLGPQKYHFRMPWFGEVVGDGKVRIDGSSQKVMDREIDFAAGAGLDYFAFLLYPESNPMSAALKLYLKSAVRTRVNFCAIIHNNFGVKAEEWPKERDRLIALLKEPGYQTVLGGRPLVYAFFSKETPAERMAEFRAAAKAAGMDPYCVFMGWNPANDFKREAAHGFDAVSAYAGAGNQPTFGGLVKAVEKDFWQNAAAAGVPYVPLVSTGWEKQPRKDNPVSWEKDQSYHKQNVFPSVATPQEIAAHLSDALKFVREHPKMCAADAVIIYAWNEHDEGGWLCPTWTAEGKPNAERLEAIGKILKKKE